MSWFKVDDRLHNHPKAKAAGLEAMGLWVLAGSHCMAYLTDGKIGLETVRNLAEKAQKRSAKSIVCRLISARLWSEIGPELYEFKDWEDYQPSSYEIRKERERISEHRRAAGLRGVEAKRQANQQANLQNGSKQSVQQSLSGASEAPSRPLNTTTTAPPPDPKPAPAESGTFASANGRRDLGQRRVEGGAYQVAFAKGVAAGLGRPWVFPSREAASLDDAIDAHAPSGGWNVRQAWLGVQGAQWAAWAVCDPAQERFRPLTVAGFVRWLNSGCPAADEFEDEYADLEGAS